MDKSTPSSSSPGLIRVLGPWVATAIVVGTVIGSGVFKKPSTIAAEVPSVGIVSLVWVLSGVLTILGALTLAEVAVLFPQAGGNYVYLREGFGRLMGFLWGWVEFWIIRAGSIAALATIFVEALHDILRYVQNMESNQAALGFWDQRAITVGVILILAGVNIRGVRWGGGLQFFITLVKVGSLLTILVMPFWFWGSKADVQFLESTGPKSFTWAGLGSAFLAAHWAYHGWMNVAPIAGEVANPRRNLPIAFLAGTGIIMFLYLGANLAYHLVIPLDDMAQLTGTPTVTEFFLRLLGPAGAILASAALMISVFGALNGNLLVGPRLLYAMGEDGLAPRWLGEVHARWRTPVLAIALMAGWACALVVSAGLVTTWQTAADGALPPKPLFDVLTDFSMFGAVIFETLAITTIFAFRRRMPDAERPYRCWGYPVVPLLFLVLPIFILCNMLSEQRNEAMVGLGFIGLGVVVYYWRFNQTKAWVGEGEAASASLKQEPVSSELYKHSIRKQIKD